MPVSSRIEALRAALRSASLDALFVTRGTNLRYLSAFTGADSFAMITPSRSFFITDSRYTEQASRECPAFEVVPWRDPFASLPETLHRLVREGGIARLGFEKRFISYGLYEELASGLPGVSLTPTENVVEDLRYVKDPGELAALRRAAEVADRAFEALLPFLAPGARSAMWRRSWGTSCTGRGPRAWPSIPSWPRGPIPPCLMRCPPTGRWSGAIFSPWTLGPSGGDTDRT